jgi:hypothetical protein
MRVPCLKMLSKDDEQCAKYAKHVPVLNISFCETLCFILRRLWYPFSVQKVKN